MRKKPRTVKNSRKDKEESQDDFNKSKCENKIPQRRRRLNNNKKEIIRKPVSICNSLNTNKSKEDLNEFEKNNKLFEIQKKINELQIEKKKLIDPSYSAFKTLEVKQMRNNHLKKDKEELLKIANKMQLGLCNEDKKSDIIDSIFEKKNQNKIENNSKLKKKNMNLKKFPKRKFLL